MVERLLPWLLAAVAGLVLAVGLHGLREQPAPDTIPGATPASPPTTPMVTEIADDIAEVVLPDGAVLVLRPGSVGYDLARFLNGPDEAPASFPARELAAAEPDLATAPSPQDASGAERSLLAVAAILQAYPTARLRIEAAPGTAGQLKAQMEAAGLPADRVESAEAADPAAPSPVMLTLVSR